jgi:hemoglobin-like flavoprotein
VFLKKRRPKETTMNDEGKADVAMAVSKVDSPPTEKVRDDRQADMDAENVRPLPRVGTGRPAGEIEDAQTQQWAREGIPPLASPKMSGVARVTQLRQVAAPMVSARRVDCPHCEGRGYVPGINDYLQESAALLTAGGDRLADAVVRNFYVTLLGDQPALRGLFPGDPTQGEFGDDNRGTRQRELLLSALAALAENYDPADPAKMETLDYALKRFGRSHASFTRPDGTVRGATLEEYKAVKDALFATLVKALADKWKPEYGEAWSQAYDYAAAGMLAEQFRSGFSAPRFARGGAVR